MIETPESERPNSIFDVPDYFRSKDEAQHWLDETPFPRNRPLHLPSHQVVKRVECELRPHFRRGDVLGEAILWAYQELVKSAHASDIICGKRDPQSKNRCGGIMDERVSAFGVFFVCRTNDKHKYPKK